MYIVPGLVDHLRSYNNNLKRKRLQEFLKTMEAIVTGALTDLLESIKKKYAVSSQKVEDEILAAMGGTEFCAGLVVSDVVRLIQTDFSRIARPRFDVDTKDFLSSNMSDLITESSNQDLRDTPFFVISAFAVDRLQNGVKNQQNEAVQRVINNLKLQVRNKTYFQFLLWHVHVSDHYYLMMTWRTKEDSVGCLTVDSLQGDKPSSRLPTTLKRVVDLVHSEFGLLLQGLKIGRICILSWMVY